MNPAGRFGRSRQFVRDRFSPEGYLGLHLTIGVLVILLCGWCFSEIAEMLGPGVPEIDQRVTTWFEQGRRSDLTSAARALTFFGSFDFIFVAALGCLLLFWRQGARDRILLLASSVIGGASLNICLKHFFHRQRPVLENPLVTLTSYGFPSGHTMDAAIFYGLLAVMAAHSVKEWRWRALISVLVALVVATIGATRIYLGAHFLTDVLGAMAAGLVWLTICWTAVETFRRRRIHRACVRLTKARPSMSS